MNQNLRRSARLAVLALFCACSSDGPRKASLPDVKLPTLAGEISASLAACPTDKCLTIYVAPWCGYCRMATPMILELRKYLKKKDISTRVIIGLDRPEPVAEYAQLFGPGTLMDINGSFPISGGVPHFFVSDGSGRILKEVAGYPQGLAGAEELAAYFELP